MFIQTHHVCSRCTEWFGIYLVSWTLMQVMQFGHPHTLPFPHPYSPIHTYSSFFELQSHTAQKVHKYQIHIQTGFNFGTHLEAYVGFLLFWMCLCIQHSILSDNETAALIIPLLVYIQYAESQFYDDWRFVLLIWFEIRCIPLIAESSILHNVRVCSICRSSSGYRYNMYINAPEFHPVVDLGLFRRFGDGIHIYGWFWSLVSWRYGISYIRHRIFYYHHSILNPHYGISDQLFISRVHSFQIAQRLHTFIRFAQCVWCLRKAVWINI